ncbi:MAG: Rpn family recombination-promoting nuclease/putative transposase [Treponema sp.]|jgi:predicted transposase/invertase (TIGR01784 family)|nr:Rpn family recombination-promoting nuclease/putative transposase [Treponema sp.]
MFARSYSKVAISPLSRYTLPMDLEVLPPTDDWVFKLLFGDQRNQRILIRFLRSFMELPPEEYQGRMFLNPHLKPEATDDKLGILDVKIKTPSGRILNIEIQVYPVKYLEKRLAFYLAKLIVEQIGKGERYGVIQPVVCICIADYDLFPRDSGYMGHFEFCKRQNGQWLEQVPLELYTIELPKAPEREDGSLVWEWVQFLRGRKKEEFEMLAERNADMREAVDMLYEISADEETRAVYEMRQKAWRDRMSQFEGYYEEGLEEGLQKGREQTARNLKLMGIPLAQIAQGTGLSEAQIKAL